MKSNFYRASLAGVRYPMPHFQRFNAACRMGGHGGARSRGSGVGENCVPGGCTQRSFPCTASPVQDFNPLETCAARRTLWAGQAPPLHVLIVTINYRAKNRRGLPVNFWLAGICCLLYARLPGVWLSVPLTRAGTSHGPYMG